MTIAAVFDKGAAPPPRAAAAVRAGDEALNGPEREPVGADRPSFARLIAGRESGEAIGAIDPEGGAERWNTDGLFGRPSGHGLGSGVESVVPPIEVSATHFGPAIEPLPGAAKLPEISESRPSTLAATFLTAGISRTEPRATRPPAADQRLASPKFLQAGANGGVPQGLARTSMPQPVTEASVARSPGAAMLRAVRAPFSPVQVALLAAGSGLFLTTRIDRLAADGEARLIERVAAELLDAGVPVAGISINGRIAAPHAGRER